MRVADIYIEYKAGAIDRSFSYICNDPSIAVGMRVKVMFANREVVGFVVKISTISEEELNNLGYSLSPVLSKIDQEPLLNEEAFKIANDMAKQCVAPLISCFQTMLPSKLKPKSSHQSAKEEVIVRYLKDAELKGLKQQEALAYIKKAKEVTRTVFNKRFSCLNRLEELGCVELFTQEVRAELSISKEDDKIVTLNEAQKKAIKQIGDKQGFHVNVLHGVTGSGKTEVFLNLAKQTLAKGKQVLILVPEISLTPQMTKRVKARFGKEVAIYHSSLNNQEKYEQFKLVYEKQVSIVVGTRSAVFMPFEDLGLIIMDEEHDQSYKQSSSPRYHCRDIAIKRGEYHNCCVVLASATPSLETYARAYKQVYSLIELPKRIYDNVPATKLIDMKQEMQNGGNYMVSSKLQNAIQERLDKKQQVIILLNRRGYSPILRCVDCGEVKNCPHCDLALNYHKSTNEFVCHTCNYKEPLNYVCPSCGSKNLKYLGMGTQKLEEYLQSVFTSARILRMDADTTNKKNAHEKMLTKFEQHEYDILVGTQMISKGLDFENVTLVGILNGDALLARSDYRSVELTFDLLVQASGRSGRGTLDGEVLIQVYDPKHYAIECARDQDYDTFFKKEMQFRHLGSYPPYAYLCSIVFWHKDQERLYKEVQELIYDMKYEGLKVLGPIELLRIQDEYRVRLLFKGKNEDIISQHVYALYKKHFKLKQQSKMEIDMNPLTIE